MRFTPQFLDELRARLPVSEVVGKRVKLRKQGREFIGLSPFNKEKSPSFTVNDQKGFFHDFSSGKHGDIFGFVMETEGVTFPEAVERLAQLAGVPLPKVSREDEQRSARAKTLHDVMELAAKFFEATLAARSGAKARGYLADRGIDAATQLKFRLGYAPGERFALKEHLGSHGIPAEDMVEAGLLIAGDDIPVPFDRFRDRVMFPITDLRGRVIAFGGRALEKDAQAKYLNSPETPLFHKGATLYNIATARQATHDGAQLIVVEGYIDVIAMVERRFRGERGAARHGADRGPARAALENGGRAGALLRRRQRRLARSLPRGRAGDAAPETGQEPDIRAAAARARPRRPGALGRARRGCRRDRRRAAARRHAVGARDRRPFVRHAGTARRAGSAHQRGDICHQRRLGAQILPAGLQRAASRNSSRRRRGRAATASATGAAAKADRGRIGASAGRAKIGSGTGRRAQARGLPPAMAGRVLTWWPASRWRAARCTAATAPRSRAARR